MIVVVLVKCIYSVHACGIVQLENNRPNITKVSLEILNHNVD